MPAPITQSAKFSGPGYTGYVLNMTSQMWLTPADSDRSIWWHYVAIIVPDLIEFPNHAVVYNTGGSNHDGPPTGTGEDEVFTNTHTQKKKNM